MFHMMDVFGFGFAGLGALWALAGIAYPVFVIWMIIDGVLRSDVEYPGTEANRKVLWVVAMVLVHPAVFAYFILVFLKVKRGSSVVAYTAPPAA